MAASPVVPTMIAAIGTPCRCPGHRPAGATTPPIMNWEAPSRAAAVPADLAVPVQGDGRGVREGQAGGGDDEEQREP